MSRGFFPFSEQQGGAGDLFCHGSPGVYGTLRMMYSQTFVFFTDGMQNF